MRPRPQHAAAMSALGQSLRTGCAVVVAVAPQLFPTPPDIARRMVELADIEDGHRVLEPSAGTGHLLVAIGDAPDKVAIEINYDLARGLSYLGLAGLTVINEDFTLCGPALGTFDRVLMNPPFENGSDIKHILRARSMLRDGGRLVAICAAGPRQVAALQQLATSWEELPAGTFAGTSVRTALMVIDGRD